MKTPTARRPRNPVAKAVRSPKYRMRTEPDKRRKLLEQLNKRHAGKTGADER